MPVCASAYCRIFNIKKQYSTEMCGCRHFGIRFCLRPHICIRVRSICRNRARTSEIPTDKPMSVTIKQVADKSFGTPPIRGRGCLRLLRERFHHEFAILHHILLLFLQFEKNHDFSRACPHPQLNTNLHRLPSADAQKSLQVCLPVQTCLRLHVSVTEDLITYCCSYICWWEKPYKAAIHLYRVAHKKGGPFHFHAYNVYTTHILKISISTVPKTLICIDCLWYVDN